MGNLATQLLSYPCLFFAIVSFSWVVALTKWLFTPFVCFQVFTIEDHFWKVFKLSKSFFDSSDTL